MILNNKSILITGGTGSFGKKFIETVIKNYKPKKLIIYSRDEQKQFLMREKWSDDLHSPLRYFIGDVRDLERLKDATRDIDIVIHAAALKHVDIAEYNPFEAVKTNIMGAQNLIEACLFNEVKKVIALSTDKASSPVNLYGASKLTSDKLFVAANNYKGKKPTKFAIARYGNVMGSRGSVVPIFIKLKDSNFFPITSKEMTRFNITLKEGVNFVIDCLAKMWGGEIFVPKIPSYKILDVAKAINPKAKIKITGLRPGEKINEEMISENEASNTLENKKYYVILPNSKFLDWDIKDYKKSDKSFKFCPKNFSYNSKTNKNFLKVNEIKKIINSNLKDFS
tara:strand:+ start:1512 stop:2525 length:1014 start_codon:yes stop_codon:yes gene_type:complete